MSRYVVLGASRGIGAALVASLAGDGHHVHAGARSWEDMQLRWPAQPHIHPTHCDVTTPSSVEHFWEQVGGAGQPIDGIIVTVGMQGEINRVADSDPADWWGTLRVNLFGPYLIVRHGLAHLSPTGRIVLCAGGGSHTPWERYSAYACAKAGVVRLVETLALELPKGQTVNAVAPGLCFTAIHETTVAAGPARAGDKPFEAATMIHEFRATGITPEAATLSVANAVACIRWLLEAAPVALTGRTISAQHDPWGDTALMASLADTLFGTTQRIRTGAVAVPIAVPKEAE